MTHYTYLIIGGGMAAAAAIHGIRELDPQGSMGLISAEVDVPYKRPPLSKGLWKGDGLDVIGTGAEDQGVDFHLGRTAQVLDADASRVVDDTGAVYTFDKLLLATGGRVRRLPFGGDNIIYYRTLSDYRRLRELTTRGQRFVVIGGGFIGWEMAAALAMNGKQVVMVFPDQSIGQRIYPPDLAQFLTTYYRGKGVEILAETSVIDVARQGNELVVKTQHGPSGQERLVATDGVVAGVGILPNVELAEAAGLEVADGVLVDDHLRTTQKSIYAAGDVASFYSPALGQRRRVEHEDNAVMMGRYAGRSMAGATEAYHHLPFFYSDLFELGYEAVGELDAKLETIAAWKEPYREGVVYYLSAGIVRGVLLWNVWGQVEAARQLIGHKLAIPSADLVN